MQEITAFLKDWTAAEQAGDVAGLDALLTDDFVGVGPLGFMLPKAAWIGRHRGGDLRYGAFDLDETDTRVHGDAAVIVARHTAQGTYQGRPIPEAVRATLVLVSDTGTWQLAGLHLSFIAGTPGAPPIPGAPAAATEGASEARGVAS